MLIIYTYEHAELRFYPDNTQALHMVKASILYFVVLVSLIIAVLTLSFIAAVYFYKLEVQKSVRQSILNDNLHSGINILLSASNNTYDSELKIALFENQDDSIIIKKERWGVFSIGTVKSFIQKDTIRSVFFIGLDSESDRSALYLSDENRPLSISGDTRISGMVELPASGIRSSYVNGQPYSGKKLVEGEITKSKRKLIPLQAEILDELRSYISEINYDIPEGDSVGNSFYNQTQVINPGLNIQGKIFRGKILIISDTTINISNRTQLNDVIVYAPAILVEEGFRGNCQLFASDSIIIGKNSRFDYPSCIGVIKKQETDYQPKVSIGNSSNISGIIFAHEDVLSPLQTMINLGKDTQITGEVYGGIIKMNPKVEVDGKISCNRFIVQTNTTLYENYLVDIKLNRIRRSKYYLSSELFGRTNSERRVLKWLN